MRPGDEAARADNLRSGVEIVQTRFRCSSTGMSRRTRAVTFWSIRAVAQPVPSDTFATHVAPGVDRSSSGRR